MGFVWVNCHHTFSPLRRVLTMHTQLMTKQINRSASTRRPARRAATFGCSRSVNVLIYACIKCTHTITNRWMYAFECECTYSSIVFKGTHSFFTIIPNTTVALGLPRPRLAPARRLEGHALGGDQDRNLGGSEQGAGQAAAAAGKRAPGVFGRGLEWIDCLLSLYADRQGPLRTHS